MTEQAESQAGQYLTFTLDGEEFALQISKVREVLDYTTITRVPRMPEFLCGVINLRGSVVPVINLRTTLGMPEAERTVDTCIVIVEVELDGEVAPIGALADSVKEVVDLEPSQIAPPPRLGTRVKNEFIQGMGRIDEDTIVILLDIDRVLSDAEYSAVTSSSAVAASGTAESKAWREAATMETEPSSDLPEPAMKAAANESSEERALT